MTKINWFILGINIGFAIGGIITYNITLMFISGFISVFMMYVEVVRLILDKKGIKDINKHLNKK